MQRQLAGPMGLSIALPRVDVGGNSFHSEHFSFAKAGVPAFSVNSGGQFLDEAPAVAEKRRAHGPRYHQPSDKYDPNWDLSGMRKQARYTLRRGRAVTDAEAMPTWRVGGPFSAVQR